MFYFSNLQLRHSVTGTFRFAIIAKMTKTLSAIIPPRKGTKFLPRLLEADL